MRTFVCRWLRTAFTHSIGQADLWAGIFGAILAIGDHFFPERQLMANLSWQIPIWALITVVGARLLFAPYWMAKEDAAEIAALESKLMPPDIREIPDWALRELFHYVNPNVLDAQPDDEAPWQTLGNSIRDAFALGHCKVWGRRATDSLAPLLGEHEVLVEIDPSYWQIAQFTYTFFFDENKARPETHIWGPNPQAWPSYTDLRVNRAQAAKVWTKG